MWFLNVPLTTMTLTIMKSVFLLLFFLESVENPSEFAMDEIDEESRLSYEDILGKFCSWIIFSAAATKENEEKF